MTPADLIEAALREHMRLKVTRTTIEHAQRGWPIPLSGGEAAYAAEIVRKALAGAGLVVVSAEDLDVAIAYAARDQDGDHSPCVARLRAALPERTTDA